MEDGNAQMAAMQAQFEETMAKLREDLSARLRIQEAANKTTREERKRRRKGKPQQWELGQLQDKDLEDKG